MQEVGTLDEAERRRLMAYLVALEDRGNADYQQKLAKKIDDRSPHRWLTIDEVEREIGGDGDEHHELDALIGTWREDVAFETAQRAFEQVDEAMWK